MIIDVSNQLSRRRKIVENTITCLLWFYFLRLVFSQSIKYLIGDIDILFDMIFWSMLVWLWILFYKVYAKPLKIEKPAMIEVSRKEISSNVCVVYHDDDGNIIRIEETPK